MKTIAEIRRDNLLLAIDRMRTATALADAADINAAYISQIKRGQPESSTGKPKQMGDEVARKIEMALKEPEGWMDRDHSTDLIQNAIPSDNWLDLDHKISLRDTSNKRHISGMITGLHPTGGSNNDQTNTEPGPQIRGKLPLISWVQAGTWESVVDNFAVGDAEDWLDCPVPHSKSAYCLHVVGDSMDDGTFEGYREGEIIFVDPGVEPVPGNDVVVRTPDGKVTFKRLKRDENGLYLFGLNGKKIIPLPEDAVFCGTVIFSGVRRGMR